MCRACCAVCSSGRTRIPVPANQVLVNLETDVAVGRQAAKVQALLGKNRIEKGFWTGSLGDGEREM